MKKFIPLMILISLLIIAATPTPPPSTIVPGVAGPAKPQQKIDGRVDLKAKFLFVQEGDSGELKANSDGTYTLKINGVLPHTIFFSERPATIAGKLAMDSFVRNFQWGGNGVPFVNAAISLRDGKENADTLIVQVRKPPQYDAQKNVITYVVDPIKNTKNKRLAYFTGKADASIPQTFNAVGLYIDTSDPDQLCGNGRISCYGGMDMAAVCHVECGRTQSELAQCFWVFTGPGCGPCKSDMQQASSECDTSCANNTSMACKNGCGLFFPYCTSR